MRSCVLAVFCGLSLTAGHAALPPEVERVLSAHNIPHDAVSIVVQSVDSDTPLLSHLPDTARNPASVMKVVTTWAGLELLGPAYQWRTEAYFLGDFDGRVLDGDLALKGYGDPELVLEEFWKLLRGLRRTGLEEIRGDLVLDDTYFEVNEDDPGAFDGQPFRAYNVVPNALLVNFKTVLFQFYAEPLGKRVRVVTEPPLPNLQVRNGLELVEGPCRGYQAGINLQIPDAAASRVQLSGQFPSRCNYYELSRAVLAHDAYAYGLFRTLWDELGGELRGTSRSAPVQEGARPALSWRSAPLGEVIRSINKNSNNVMTRQLLYTIGAETFGAPGTRDKGIAAIRDFLAAQGFDLASLVIDNGAGLSRNERISAGLLADILRAAHRSPYAAEFIASLSLGGLDGTTRRRFNGHAEAGRMHVKTGRLDHVAAVAGYAHSAGGKTHVVVVAANAPEVHRGPGEELQHAVLHWLHEHH